MVREIAKTYPQADILDSFSWLQSGVNTDGCHHAVTSHKVQKGDNMVLNCFPMIQGYYGALERTLFLDHATDEQLKVWEANTAVYRRGCDLIQPGVKCCDIALELNEMYREKNLLQYRSFGYGHALGIMCHYYGRNSGLEFREDNETVLEPGMVLTMEPMITIPCDQPGAGGYREHDSLIIHADRAENVNTFPAGPEHMIIKSAVR